MNAKLSERAIGWIKRESGGDLVFVYRVAEALGVSSRSMAGAWPTVLSYCEGPSAEDVGGSLMFPFGRRPEVVRERGLRFAWDWDARQFGVCYRLGADETGGPR